MKKRVIGIILASVMTVSSMLTGCGNQKNENDDKLVVWTFTDEIKKMIEDYYYKDFPEKKDSIEVVIIPSESYQGKLDPALQAGKDAPDIFAIEATYAKKYVDSNLTSPLSDIGIDESDLEDVVPYVNEVVTDGDGRLKGVSWQACPGAVYYRRSLAEKYLGVSEPEDVQNLMSDWDGFMQVAKKIHDGSNGEVKMVPGPGEIGQIFYANRTQKWVEDNKLQIDPVIEEYLDLAKELQQEGYTAEVAPWSEGWYQGMNQNNIFCYALPSWGLSYLLKQNCENKDDGTTTAGDWGVVQGPQAYFNGGTWLTLRSGTEKSEEAKDLMEYLTLNEDFLERYAKDTGDVVCNMKVQDKIKEDFNDEFLAGQNHYAEFVEMSRNVDASILGAEDLDIQNLLGEAVTAYSKGEKEKDVALEDFKDSVKNAFPNVNVE